MGLTFNDMKFPIAASAVAHAILLLFAFIHLPGLSGMGGADAGRVQMVSLVDAGAFRRSGGRVKSMAAAAIRVRREAEADAAPSAAPAETVEERAEEAAGESSGLAEGAGQGAGHDYGQGAGFGAGVAASYKDMVRARIEAAKFYPFFARQRGYEGVVGVRFKVAPDGSVKDVEVASPCHCDALNKAACEAVKRAAPLPAPQETIAMEVILSYRLEER